MDDVLGRLIEVEKKSERHDQDLYRGDGRKPGITSRLELIERSLAAINRLSWLVAGGIIALAVDIAVRLSFR